MEDKLLQNQAAKKIVTLKIVGSSQQGDEEDDSMELITEGTFYKRGESLYLVYDESQLSGLEGCRTRLKLSGKTIKMRRVGESVGIDTEIEFEKGKRYKGYYDTAFGTVEMEVLTNEITNTLTAEGTGIINIDYNISLKGLMEGRSNLNIKVM